MIGPFAVEGYDVLAPLDGAGRRWRAVCLADARPVVLRRWIGAGERRGEVRRQAALWSSVGGDAVVAVRDVRCDGADLIVVSDAAGDPLDLLLERRGPLRAGQVVTLVVGLATSLVEAHRRGLAHGRLDASSVVVDEAGRPRLTDYAFGGDAAPSADVVALVALASYSFDGTPPPPLLRALDSAVDAHVLAEQMLSAAPAEPLLSLPAPSAPKPVALRRPTSRRVRRSLLVTVTIVVLATAIGVWWGRQEPAAGVPPPRVSARPIPSLPTPTPTPALEAAVVALERQRLHALAQGDVEALAVAELRGTSLWRRDVRTVTRLVTAHLRLRGLHVDVRRTEVMSASARRAVVRVVDAMTSYEVVDANGVVVARRPMRPARTVDLVLVQDNGKWKIRAVSRQSR